MQTSIVISVEISFTLSANLEQSTLHDLQRDIRRESKRALRRALESAIAQVEKALLTEPVLCPGCHRPMRSRGKTARRIVTVFGTLDIERVRYACGPCRTVRRPLDEWIGLLAGTEYTGAVLEQALYLTADLSYERAADVLRHVGGIGISGRQIQRLLEAESEHIQAAVGTKRDVEDGPLHGRFRRAGRRGETAGAQRVLQLRQLKTSGRWDDYWARRFQEDRSQPASGPADGSAAGPRLPAARSG